MVTTEFKVKPNISALHYEDGVMIPEHTDSTVEITLEYVTDWLQLGRPESISLLTKSTLKTSMLVPDAI